MECLLFLNTILCCSEASGTVVHTVDRQQSQERSPTQIGGLIVSLPYRPKGL